jgi:hypothetical protein
MTSQPHQWSRARTTASDTARPGSGSQDATAAAPANCSHARGSGPADAHWPAPNHAITTRAGPMERNTPAAERSELWAGFEARIRRLFYRPGDETSYEPCMLETKAHAPTHHPSRTVGDVRFARVERAGHRAVCVEHGRAARLPGVRRSLG